MNAAAEILRLHPADDVVIARRDLDAGVTVAGTAIVTRQPVPRGHKIAVRDLGAGDAIRKYGHVIARASRSIAAGEHVHDHNLTEPAPGAPGSGDGTVRAHPPAQVDDAATFDGFVRAHGRAGTRNYVGILTTVNCSATVARQIADTFRAPEALADHPNVDGVVALTHPSGCGMSAEGTGREVLERVLRGYLAHPNFAATLLIGLGCEVNRIGAYHQTATGAPVQAFDIQDAGGTRRAVEQGVARVRELLVHANEAVRSPVPIGELCLALQCGGSDAFSAITANPALGVAADHLVAGGGTAILSETPETAPWAELLCAGAVSADVDERLRALVRWWEAYTRTHGTGLQGNPSPGNRAGGISTIAEKALGAIAKGGSTPLAGVYAYAERIDRRGLVFMDSPGFDPVSATGQIAAGANLMCFTTGRGSVFGARPTPCLKLATNSELYMRMREDMDLDCGVILDGGEGVQAVGARIFRRLIEVASGAPTCSELLGFGEAEFAPWQLGATL